MPKRSHSPSPIRRKLRRSRSPSPLHKRSLDTHPQDRSQSPWQSHRQRRPDGYRDQPRRDRSESPRGPGLDRRDIQTRVSGEGSPSPRRRPPRGASPVLLRSSPRRPPRESSVSPRRPPRESSVSPRRPPRELSPTLRRPSLRRSYREPSLSPRRPPRELYSTHRRPSPRLPYRGPSSSPRRPLRRSPDDRNSQIRDYRRPSGQVRNRRPSPRQSRSPSPRSLPRRRKSEDRDGRSSRDKSPPPEHQVKPSQHDKAHDKKLHTSAGDIAWCSCDCKYCETSRSIQKRLKEAWERDQVDSDASGLEAAKRGAVGDRFGKYGIINDGSKFTKRAEFQVWVSEVKNQNYEEISQVNTKNLWLQFVEDYNTATFPSKKYYDLAAWEARSARRRKLDDPTPIFDDEELRRQELRKVREKEKERLMDEAYNALRNDSETLEAMKRQKELKTRMDYLFKTGKIEQAREIQSLLRAEDTSRIKDSRLEVAPLEDF